MVATSASWFCTTRRRWPKRLPGSDRIYIYIYTHIYIHTYMWYIYIFLIGCAWLPRWRGAIPGPTRRGFAGWGGYLGRTGRPARARQTARKSRQRLLPGKKINRSHTHTDREQHPRHRHTHTHTTRTTPQTPKRTSHKHLTTLEGERVACLSKHPSPNTTNSSRSADTQSTDMGRTGRPARARQAARGPRQRILPGEYI